MLCMSKCYKPLKILRHGGSHKVQEMIKVYRKVEGEMGHQEVKGTEVIAGSQTRQRRKE